MSTRLPQVSGGDGIPLFSFWLQVPLSQALPRISYFPDLSKQSLQVCWIEERSAAQQIHNLTQKNKTTHHIRIREETVTTGNEAGTHNETCKKSQHSPPQNLRRPRKFLLHRQGIQTDTRVGPSQFISVSRFAFSERGLSGPMALDHQMTTGVQDPQTLLMNMREVQSYYDSLANNSTKGLQSGSILSVKNPTCQPTMDLSQFIVKQVPRRSGSYLNHEPNVKILLSDIKTMASPLRLTIPFATTKQLLLCVNPRQLKTTKM